MKSAEHTDWLAYGDQQMWFDSYKSNQVDGLQFNQFQVFLEDTIYKFFSNFPIKVKKQPTSNGTNNNDKQENTIQNEDKLESSDRFTKRQEMQLFKVFDIKNDHVLDRDEFAAMCSKWIQSVYKPVCGLVIVDVQNDFIDGSLSLINGPAKQDGLEVVPVINDLIDRFEQNEKSQSVIAYTQDWHPPDHIGFHANLHMRKYTLKNETDDLMSNAHDGRQDRTTEQDHIDDKPSEKHVNNNNNDDDKNNFKFKKLISKAKLFDTVLFDDGRLEQKLWPIHCVQNSWGAQLHPKLRRVSDAICIKKGTLSNVDAYSAFWDNMHLNETGLRQELAAKKVTDVFFCGLAFEFCVTSSALDSVKAGFVTYVIEDACRGIDNIDIAKRREEMLDNNVFIVQSNEVKDYLLAQHQQQQHEITTNSNCINLDRDFFKKVTFRKALV